MTPEEIEVFREWCKVYELPDNSWTVKALKHIDQQATSLAATEERVREHEAHENQTHEVLGKILGTDDTLENVAQRAVDRISELESQIIQQTGISANRMEERERMQKQIAALQKIAIEQKAMRICIIPANWWNEGEQVKEYFRASARRQLAKEHPEAFR